MGMVVRTNTMALNAYRQLGMNNSAVTKSLEKLSSGFRINRAGDDAAGLAISEKMKAQITGLETASANAQDGISLIQTAEGNLGEVHDMLNRMVELATKSANGTYTDTERKALQDEVDQLLDEIDRISQSANFNGTKLLNGTMGLNQDAFKIGETVTGVPGSDISDKLTYASRVAAGDAIYHEGTSSVTRGDPSFVIDLGDIAFTAGDAGNNHAASITIAGKVLDAATDALDSDVAYDAKAIRNAIMLNSSAWTGKSDNTNTTGTDGTDGYVDIGGAMFKVTALGDTQLKFEYAGVAAAADEAPDKAALTPTIATDINGAIGAGVTSTMTAATGGSVTGFVNHDTLMVKQAVAAEDGKRAGIDVTLTADVVKVGNTITIDGKEFTFVSDDGTKTLADNEIGIKSTLDLTDTTDQGTAIHSIVDQLSNKTFTNVQVQSKNGATIHVEQLVGNKNAYDNEAKLHALVTAKSASTSDGTELTVTADKIISGDSIRIGDNTYTFGEGKGQIAIGQDGVDAVANLTAALEKDGFTVTVSGDKLTIAAAVGEDAPAIIGGGLTLQIGDTADSYNKMTVAVADMSAKGLGLEELKKSGIMTESSASNAIDTIKTAINTVSSTRASMGALQNRLEHTINNLDVAAENLSAANSRIRDTDMAKEMMNYTKMNVLVQSAQAMLAQANQQPQRVLQLLQ